MEKSYIFFIIIFIIILLLYYFYNIVFSKVEKFLGFIIFAFGVLGIAFPLIINNLDKVSLKDNSSLKEMLKNKYMK